MRSILWTLVSIPLLALAPRLEPSWAAPPTSLSPDQEEIDPEEWTEVVTRELPDGLVRLSAGQGAMGTSALAVEMGKVRGTLLVDRRYGDQVSIFLGWSPPEKYAERAHEDLCVRFRDADGQEHVTTRFAGGPFGAQFASPQDVEIEELQEFTLLVRRKAKWLKGR